MVNINKYFLSLILCVPGFLAGQASTVPNAKQWVQEASFSSQAKNRWVHRVAFIKSVKGSEVEFFDLDQKDFNEDTFFDLVTKEEVNSYLKLNAEVKPELFNSPEDYFKKLLQLSTVDTIVYSANGDKRWNIYSRSSNGTAKREFAAKEASSDGEPELKAWLIEKLGYSGFVLAKKGKYVLVGSLKSTKKAGNALYIGDSENKFRVKEGKAAFGGLLRLINTHDNVSVYEVVMKSKKPVKKGSKLLL